VRSFCIQSRVTSKQSVNGFRLHRLSTEGKTIRCYNKAMSKDVFHAQSVNGKLSFGTEYNKARFDEFIKANNGVRIKIIPNTDISYNKRRFFEGAIVPFFALQHLVQNKEGKTVVMGYEEARSLLKLWFNPEYIRNSSGGEPTEIAGSSKKLNNKEFTERLIEQPLAYMRENGFILPNEDDYKEWRDSSPLIGEVYPPVARMLAEAKAKADD